MRIKSIVVRNFRAINFVEIRDVPNAVVIAGPNGCGKSSIFDAIRLVKSAYGQYRNNEFSSWFGEFQIDLNRLQVESERILNDPCKPMKIEIEFNLSPSEVGFIKKNAVDIYKKIRWSQISRKRDRDGDISLRDPRTQMQDGEIVDRDANEMASKILSSIDKDVHVACLTMEKGGYPSVVSSPILELIFSIYQPQDIGIIDYQSPSRTYGREQVSNLNLQIRDSSASKSAQHALYDTQNKYTGVKTEMAQSYVREILAEKAGVPIPEKNTLKSTLDELFSVFFPGKKFLGAIPTEEGGLEFPVLLENGRKHDINELSSGEKEVLLGYLRLRNSAPRNSIILLDEPELHLNPRLAAGLPRFYQKHLGEALNNQIWLVSHSDAILREAVQESSYCVFHMAPASQTDGDRNQADQVNVKADIENAIFSLVGDLATYSPRSKIVLIEGEDSEFDAKVISQLFPAFAGRVNLVSLGSKGNVRNSHEILERAASQGRLDARFYSIVDRDLDVDNLVSSENQFNWDVYHIENFLLEPVFIVEALDSMSLGSIKMTKDEVMSQLKECAKETIRETTRILMRRKINSLMVGSISLSFDPRLDNAEGFHGAVSRSFEKISEVANTYLSSEKISEIEAEIDGSLERALKSDDWLKEFRGRNILKKLADKHAVKYITLRNLIVSGMRTSQFEPKNMKFVVEKILQN